VNAGGAVAAVPDPVDVDGAKDGPQSTPLKPAVVPEGRSGPGGDLESGANVTVATLLHMSLQEEALQIAAFVLLLLLDQMEWEMAHGSGREPAFQ
jgi:hypothetical protein